VELRGRFEYLVVKLNFIEGKGEMLGRLGFNLFPGWCLVALNRDERRKDVRLRHDDRNKSGVQAPSFCGLDRLRYGGSHNLRFLNGSVEHCPGRERNSIPGREDERFFSRSNKPSQADRQVVDFKG
jgi:hypothetical protein